jgi:Response regulator containing CheY-like receiver, AAA-type ATPase, and DNA-binding domains
VLDGRFREDLFHRINVIRLRVPALRERREDIPPLLEHFLARAAAELKAEPKHLRPEVVDRLRSAPWRGNVRELENLCRWLTVMAPGREVMLGDLPPDTGIERPATAAPSSAPVAPHRTDDWREALRLWARDALASGRSDLLAEAGPAFEIALIQEALAACGGQRQDAARRLGWGRNTLTRKIKELGL